MTIFHNHGVQLEGWFKGELLVALDSLMKDRVIQTFDREVRRQNRRIDLLIEIQGKKHYVELKHWLIGEQRGTTYGPEFYFRDKRSVSVIKDVSKLNGLSLENAERWLLLLLTKNPGGPAWERSLAEFTDLQSFSDPNDFPNSYFLGLIRVGQPAT